MNVAVGDPQHAVRAAAGQDAVLVVEEPAVLHRQVRPGRPDARAVVPDHRGSAKVMPRMVISDALGNENALLAHRSCRRSAPGAASPRSAGARHAKSRSPHRSPGSIRTTSPSAGHRGRLARHLQHPVGPTASTRAAAAGHGAKHCGGESDCGMASRIMAADVGGRLEVRQGETGQPDRTRERTCGAAGGARLPDLRGGRRTGALRRHRQPFRPRLSPYRCLPGRQPGLPGAAGPGPGRDVSHGGRRPRTRCCRTPGDTGACCASGGPMCW